MSDFAIGCTRGLGSSPPDVKDLHGNDGLEDPGSSVSGVSFSRIENAIDARGL